MGILDALGDVAKKGGQLAKNSIDAAVTKMQQMQEVRRLKSELLSNFRLDDMKAFCKQWGYEGPDPYYEDENGRKHKGKLDRDDWFGYCMDFSLDKIKKYAEGDRRISQDARDVLMEIEDKQKGFQSQEKTTYEDVQKVNTVEKPLINQIGQTVSVPSGFEEILSVIRTKYEDAIRDAFFTGEDQFNDHLVGYLRAKFEDKHRIEDTHKLHRDTGDIFIDGKYVLELKYADSIGTLDKGTTEAKRYKEKGYPGVAIIILDIGKLTGSLPQYKRWYEEEGAKVIILRGKGERRKPKIRMFVEKP